MTDGLGELASTLLCGSSIWEGHLAFDGHNLRDFFKSARFRTRGRSATDLNTLISDGSPLQLQTACGINSRGEITGLAVKKSTGQYRGYLAIPVAGANSGR